MHYVFTTFGSAGDTFPFIGLAVELQRRGHDVTFLAGDYFRDAVERAGLPYELLGTREEFLATIQHPDLWTPRKAFPHLFRHLGPMLRKQYELIARHHHARPTAVVANTLSFGAVVAQEKLGLPVVSVHLQPAVLWSNVNPPKMPGLFGPRWLKCLQFWLAERFIIDATVCPFLNGWRKELGLPPVQRIVRWWHSRTGVVCLFPEWYASQQPDWPARSTLVDFPLWDDPAEGLSPEIEAFLTKGPPIVFTPGSANIHAAAFFRAAVDACLRLKRPGMLLTRFAEQIPANLPSNVIHVPFVPFTAFLARVAAVVHHGGIGTAAQAMAAGVPQLIMPLAHDQFDNANRLRHLNLGDSLLPTQFTGERVAKKLTELLHSPKSQTACAAVKVRLSKRDGLTRAADNVERIVVESAGSAVATR